jgi:UDP-2-acetamido-3-amino-2,3-dideoxy-glucuronate N-acetyltransferase
MDQNKYFCHASSDIQTVNIGDGTKIWQFCVVLLGAKIGARCNICSHCFVENDVVVGDDVTVKCGVQLWDGIILEDHVFVGPNVTFTNDSNPRSKAHKTAERTIVRKGASIGANATVLPGIVIGERAMIGAGSVVTQDVPMGVVVVGNPARFVRYVDANS